jgi:hypothetical protein
VARGTRWLVASAGVVSLLAAACGSSTSSAGSTNGKVSGKLVVFAAASLNGLVLVVVSLAVMIFTRDRTRSA